MEGLDWQLIQIPLAAGLNQKADDRARLPPKLDVCVDAQFDELGGIQLRRPYALEAAGAVSNMRRIVPNGNELIAFAKGGIYTLDDANNVWRLRAEHLAVKVTERAEFVTTGEQISCDRAELANVIVIAWADAGSVFVALKDKLTGAVLLSSASAAGERPRVVALSTKVLMFWHSGSSGSPADLKAIAIDPAAPASVAGSLAAPTTVLAAPNFARHYDVTRQIGADVALVVARRTSGTDYMIAKVTAALAVTAATKVRPCSGPIAVSCTPDGVSAQVVRMDAVTIEGDLITISTLADVFTSTAIGTAVGAGTQQIACAHRSVADGGQFRCYVFWHDAADAGLTNWFSNVNYIDTANATGAAATFVRRMAVASRAFDHEGRVYFWGTFAGESGFTGAGPSGFRAQLQNSYFLYRDDGFLVAKATYARSGGFPVEDGHLPGVALTDGTATYSWCGVERRAIPLGGEHSGYADRGPRDITFTFDSNEARRVAKLGRTLYIAGGEVLQYDGVNVVELGFHVFPWYFDASQVAGGNLADGTYTYKATLRSENAVGELDRSTTATHANVTVTAGPKRVQFSNIIPLYITHKTSKAPALEMWRTAVNPVLDAPFYLVTSKDPNATTNPNRYLANDTTVSVLSQLNDDMSDATATTKETNPENGDILENIPPPPASIIVATDTRLFLGGVSGDPDRVWYSKQRAEGEVAAFNDALVVDVPAAGGDMTGLAFNVETLVVFRKSATYAFPGDGFDNFGGGRNYGPVRELSTDLGALEQESIATTPAGTIFRSRKGWYLLTRGWSLEYIGGPIADYEGEAAEAAHVVEAQHQIRIVTANRILVYDYLANQWAEWTLPGQDTGLSAAMWRGAYAVLTPAGVNVEQSSFAGTLDYGIDVETAWIKVTDLQSHARIRAIQILGEYRSAHQLRIRIAYDYDPTYIDDVTWPTTPTTVGGPLQVRIGPSRQRVQAIKVRITAVATGAGVAATLDTDPNMSPRVALAGGLFWNAILTWDTPGVGGNAGKLDYVITDGAGVAGVNVRNSQRFDLATNSWVPADNTVGVAVFNANASGALVADLEAEIDAESVLASVTTADGPHAALTLAYPGAPTRSQGSFSGGSAVTSPPTGEALKLTGIALEVGFKRGFKGLPAAQRT